ncbi:MAG: 3-hydroxyisobutyrate dehydrogenase [Alphaproteobacteria bacterium]|tara:strand:- start:675 stop:1571 length:897 start_codon:yes stop_codon:yes gene_type:complete
MSQIGFIGLGNMGGPMVSNLIQDGHKVKAYDIIPEAIDRAVNKGATKANSAEETIIDAEFVITMLPAGEHVRSVYLEDNKILYSVSPKTVLIDSSTIDVITARQVMEVAAQRGIEMIDAPVSGGVGGADAGTLTFMCGGKIEAYDKAESILKSMGKNIFHAGDAGSGQAAKVCNNLMLAIQMIGVSEGFLLAEKLDLDIQKLWDIASTATSKCWSMTDYCPVPGPVPTSPANKDYSAGFTVAMMLKDLNLSQVAAKDNGLNTPLGAKATELYNTFSQLENNSELDFSAIIKQISNINK